MSVIVKGGGGENVTPEVTAQTPVITQIAENLGVTITTPSGTNKQILQGNNANLLNIKNNAKKEGLYVWKKLTAEGGDFIDFVVSDNESAYPDGGYKSGYWYEKVVGIDVILSLFGSTKYSVDKIIPASNISHVNVTPFNHTLGEIPKYAFLRANRHSASTDGYWEIIEGFGSNIEVNAGYSTMYTDYDGGEYAYNSYPPNMTENTIGFRCSGAMRAMAGIEYTLITMA